MSELRVRKLLRVLYMLYIPNGIVHIGVYIVLSLHIVHIIHGVHTAVHTVDIALHKKAALIERRTCGNSRFLSSVCDPSAMYNL